MTSSFSIHFRRPIVPCVFAIAALSLMPGHALAFDLPAPAVRAPLYNLTFEKADVRNDGLHDGKLKRYQLRTEGGGHTAVVISDPHGSSKVIVFKTDPTPAAKTKDRTEMQIYSGIDFGKTWALAMKVFIPEHVRFTDNWHTLLQCPQAGALHPPFSINLLAPGQFALVSRTDEDAFKNLFTADLPKGRWVQFELEFRMGNKGHIKLWMDDKLMTDQAAVLRFKTGAERCNLKVGTYRGKANTPHEVRLDDIRLGTSREAVLPR